MDAFIGYMNKKRASRASIIFWLGYLSILESNHPCTGEIFVLWLAAGLLYYLFLSK